MVELTAKILAKAGVWAQKTVGEEVKILLPLVETLGRPPKSSSSPFEGGLWQSL